MNNSRRGPHDHDACDHKCEHGLLVLTPTTFRHMPRVAECTFTEGHSLPPSIISVLQTSTSLYLPRCITSVVDTFTSLQLRRSIKLTASSASAWRHPEKFSIDEQLFVGRYLAFCRSCSPWEPQEIKKFQNPSYTALAYFPQRQWINYTTNRTKHLRSIHCPLKVKWIYQLKRFIILSIFQFTARLQKK